MAEALPFVKPRWFDENGDPLAGGKLYTYRAGTTTPLVSYADQAGITPNPNPVVLDANGEATVFLGSDRYKLVLKDANEVEQWSQDNIAAGSGTGAGSGAWASHAITAGQSATNLSGETVNSATYKAALYRYVIKRGTTVFASGRLALHYRNSAWQLLWPLQGDQDDTAADPGVTFSISGTTTAQLLAAVASDGAGNGTIDLARELVPA